MNIEPIAIIENLYDEKFGVPRQSGQVTRIISKIVMCEKYRNADAFRGLDGFSHLWLLWHFSIGETQVWSPTVRPPRLGGNKRIGVFATRSPFRPNPIGLTCVKIEKIVLKSDVGPYIEVSGADMVSGTPIFDIKPYVPHADCIENSIGGFSDEVVSHKLDVIFPDEISLLYEKEFLDQIAEVLSYDPRPGYQNDETRIYKMSLGGYTISFRVSGVGVIVISIDLNKYN